MPDVLNETEFIERAQKFLTALRGPEHPVVACEQDLVNEAGLDSLQLIALLEFVEQLRGEELLEIPELGELTLRNVYHKLLIGQDGTDVLLHRSSSDSEEM